MTKHPNTQARKNDEVGMPNTMLELGASPSAITYSGFPWVLGYFVIRISGRIPPTEHKVLIH